MVKQQDNLYEQLSEKRKELQGLGLIPEWYSTAALQVFQDKYQYQADSVKEQFERIANTAAKHLSKIGLEQEARKQFFNLFWKGWLSPSTPVLANMGTDRGLPVSCSGGFISDSIEGFYSGRKETAILTKHGFGTSAYLGDIRPRGSSISVGGKASGVVPVFKGFVQDMRDVAQGTARRGAWAGYLPIEHGDFDELVDHILAETDDANIGWIIPNSFIDKLDSGNKEAIRRYQKALKMKMITGKGYFFFSDKVQEKRPQVYKDRGLDVKSSNLCFTGDTMVACAQSRGPVPIKQLAEESNGVNKFTVFSAKKHSENNGWSTQISGAVAFKTGTKQVIEITLSDNTKFKCTPDHQLATKEYGYVEARYSYGVELKPFTYISSTSKVQNFPGYKDITVIDIKYLDEPEDVYDLTVENNHNFYIITNIKNYVNTGILVHNCSEIMLHSDEDHTFTCVLSSMNVAKYDEWKDTDAVYWATIFLDCVAEDFIQKGKNISGLESAIRFTEKGRALGLGVMGFHTYLQKNMIPFEGLDAMWKNNEIFNHIYVNSHAASKWMAKEIGEPEWCREYGVRNTHRIAIAPNKSSSLLMGGVSEGINPDPAMSYSQTTAAGEVDRINPTLLNIMKSRDVYNKKTIKDITDHNGSVQHVLWLNELEKQVFKTAFEINQEVIIRLASQRAKYIDQWQSLNLFFSSEEDESEISRVHKIAFKDPNILALYYVYSRSGVQGAQDKSECIACS